MSRIKVRVLVTVLVLCAALAAGAQAATVTASGGSIPAAGQVANFPISVDSLPDGISGFNITASLSDPTKAEIVGILFPSWAPLIPGFVQISPLPADSVWYVGVDFGDQVKPGATNVDLGTVQVRGDATGTTDLQLTLNMFDTELGDQIPATVVPGTITIGTPTVPTTEPTTVPTTEPTTVPTTEPTTVPTTEPTTVPTTEPTTVPTTEPTTVPTTEPTTVPTTVPTTAPAGYGTVFVNSYPTGATVLVDGVDKGRTNIIIPSVPAGVRTFTVMKEGYLTQTFPVTVPVGGIATPPRVTLVKGTSPTTTVTTVPTGTQATTATTTTTLTTSITTAATTTPMPGTTGSLFIMYCSPAGAEIFIDGEFAGYSSMFGSRISGISPGSHVLTISREGYVTDERTIAITAGKTTFIPVIYLRPRIIF